MLVLEFKTKQSVLALRQTVRTACEEQGLRLGQSEQKTDYITSRILGAGCINEAMAKVQEKPQPATTLTAEDLEALRAIEFPDRTFHVDMLTNKEPRTLLYGYNCDMGSGADTVHIYLCSNGLIHALTYDYEQRTKSHYSGKAIEADKLRPSKRAYPSRTDKEFAFKLNELLEHKVTYTGLEEVKPAQYYGKLAETLEPTPEEYIRARELSLALSDHIQNHYSAILDNQNFDPTYSDRNHHEVYNVCDPITSPIRRVGFSFSNGRKLSQDELNNFIKAFENELLIESLTVREFELKDEFNELFTKLLSELSFTFELPELSEYSS